MACPNHSNCQLIHQRGFLPDPEMKARYEASYCRGDGEPWQHCKRYMTHQAWNLCPDFVLPDTPDTVDHIMERYEAEMDI